MVVREPLLPIDPPPEMPLPARARDSAGRLHAKNMSKNRMLNNLSSRIFRTFMVTSSSVTLPAYKY